MLSFLRVRPRLAFDAIKWTFVRSVTDINLNARRKLMLEFDHYLMGRRSKETVFYIMKACATGLETEQPHSKVTLADHVYTSMKTKGLQFNTMLYNLLLQVYLANRHMFSPADILSIMKEENILPNRGTLSLLLQGYCQQGNIAGAKEILTELKARDMAINEEVYAALISGHAFTGNMDAAKQVIQMMKQGELPPGLTSYSALLSGYAYNGDIESIKNTIATMKEERIFVPYHTFGDMVDAVSRGGHHDRTPEVLDMIRNKEWMYNELLRKAELLSTRGEGESSVHIINFLAKLNLIGEGQRHLNNACLVMLRNMVLTDKPLDCLLSCAAMFAENNDISTQDIYEELLRAMFMSKKWSDGKSVLQEMQKRVGNGFNPKLLHFYPAIAASVKSQNIKEHFDWLNILINDFQLVPDNIIAGFTAKVMEAEKKEIVQYLKEENIVMNKSHVMLITEMLCDKFQYDKLYETLKQVDKSILPTNEILDRISRSSTNIQSSNLEALFNLLILLAPDVQQLKKVVYFIVRALSNKSKPSKDAYMFINKLINKNVLTELDSGICNHVLISLNDKRNFDEFFHFVKLMNRFSVKLDYSHNRQILKFCAKTGLADRAEIAYRQLEQDDAVDSLSLSHLIIALNRGNRRKTAIEFYEKSLQTNPEYVLFYTAYTTLLYGYISKGDIKSALNIKSKLIDNGFRPGLAVYNSLMDGYAKIGDIANAQAQFDKIVSIHDMTPSIFSYHKLMQSYAYHKDLDNVRRLLQEAESRGLTISKAVVLTLMNVCISVNDLQSALEYSEKFSKTGVSASNLPLITLVELFVSSIKKDEPGLTDRIVDTLKKMNVSMDTVHHSVMFALLKCAEYDKAVALARKHRLEMNTGLVSIDLISEFGKYCQTNGDVDCLRLLMNLLREFGTKPFNLHVPLIRAYAVNDDIHPLLSIGEELKSCGETPQESFHSTLSKLLQQHSKETPFVLSGSDSCNSVTAANS